MDDVRPSSQRIERLTPLADVLALIDAQLAPIVPREVGVSEALGRVLAGDIDVRSHPPAPLSLRDGYAVRSEETNDAGSYAPAPLSLAVRVEVGDRLPDGADAVTPLDAVDGCAQPPQALAPIAPGEGVLAAGQDADADASLLRKGRALRAADLAILAAAGVTRVPVRVPTIRLVTVRREAVAGAIVSMMKNLIAPNAMVAESQSVEDAFSRLDETDAVIVVGGSGSGLRDGSVRALARAGRVAAHGIGLIPGETSAFGFIGSVPVLIVPGRLDAGLAVWHVLGARMTAKLSARGDLPAACAAKLARKIASTVGLVEFVPVRADGDAVIPVASGYLPWRALAQATDYVLVPAPSEGFAAGAVVQVMPL
jgi:molybdopterin biosynthesis enzyme